MLLFSLWTQHAFSQRRLLEYSNEVPSIDYAQPTNDSVTRLFDAINRGEININYEGERGYLDALLEVLSISPTSQVLIFSKTALKGRLVSPMTPRAIYFNDDLYISFIPGTPALEIASMDPLLGPVFYEIPLEPEEGINLRRHTSRCLNCHVQNYLADGAVPVMLYKSALVNESGEIFINGLAQRHTNTTTVLAERWGGWYVTGLHGEQQHRGNLNFVTSPNVESLDLSGNGNLTSLEGLFATDPYITPYSDIVALLVMQHQVDVQNEISRVNYQVSSIISREGEISNELLAEKIEPLLRALFMSDEAPLTNSVSGVSGFTDFFQTIGPKDSEGRSLRDFDLQSRIFRYPLSFQIYSEAFNALPEEAFLYLRQRITSILNGLDQSSDFAHISESERKSIFEIIEETKPDFLIR